MVFNAYLFARNFVIIYCICHITLAFVVPYLIVPNCFVRYVPEIKDTKLEKVLNKLKKIKNKEKFVRACFDFVIESTYCYSFGIIKHLPRVYLKDVKQIIETEGYIPCNVQNFLIEALLARSGKFKQEEVIHRYDIMNFGIHQYLIVYVNGKRIELDPWGYRLGKPYGKHALGVRLSYKKDSRLNRFISIREAIRENVIVNGLKNQLGKKVNGLLART